MEILLDTTEKSIPSPFTIAEVAFHVRDLEGKENERYLAFLLHKCDRLLEEKPCSNRGAVVRTVEIENPYELFMRQLKDNKPKKKNRQIERRVYEQI